MTNHTPWHCPHCDSWHGPHVETCPETRRHAGGQATPCALPNRHQAVPLRAVPPERPPRRGLYDALGRN